LYRWQRLLEIRVQKRLFEGLTLLLGVFWIFIRLEQKQLLHITHTRVAERFVYLDLIHRFVDVPKRLSCRLKVTILG